MAEKKAFVSRVDNKAFSAWLGLVPGTSLNRDKY